MVLKLSNVGVVLLMPLFLYVHREMHIQEEKGAVWMQIDKCTYKRRKEHFGCRQTKEQFGCR